MRKSKFNEEQINAVLRTHDAGHMFSRKCLRPSSGGRNP
jgi:hypothetical protein